MAWQSPKTNWAAADGVRDSDMNRIEGNILELYNSDMLRSDVTIYVSTSGNDTTGNGTSTLPFATLTKALNMLPKNLNGKNVTISVAAGSYNDRVAIKDFSNGIVTIGGTSFTIVSLEISNCFVKTDINISVTGSLGVLVTNKATFITNGNLTTNSSSTGLAITNCSEAYVGGTLAINGSTTGVSVSNNSRAFVQLIVGTGNNTGMAASAGAVLAYGTYSATNTAAIFTTNTGGRVNTGSQSGMGGGVGI